MFVYCKQDGQENETCSAKNVYLENIHWKKGGLLGTGAFSSCYEAMDFKSGRLMAVKQVNLNSIFLIKSHKAHKLHLKKIVF